MPWGWGGYLMGEVRNADRITPVGRPRRDRKKQKRKRSGR